MASFDVTVASSVHRDVRRLDPGLVRRLFTVMAALGDSPLPDGVRKLTGSESSYRVRVGDYRVLYDVDFRNRRVRVYKILRRRDAYR